MAGQPMGGAQQKTSGKAIAALICGILGCCVPYLGLLVGIAGLILGIMAMKEIKANPAAIKGKGMALTGVILGAIAIIWWIAVFILIGTAISSLQTCLKDPQDPICKSSKDVAGGSWTDFVPAPIHVAASLVGLPLWAWG